MPQSHNLINEYSEIDGQICSEPHWIIAVTRFKYPFTYSRKSKSSFSDDFGEAVRTRGAPLIITSDALQVSTNSPKGTPIATMNAVLAPGSREWLSEIFPDDWVYCWMFSSVKEYREILRRLSAKTIEPCNYYHSGLKFVGRIDSLVKNIVQSPDGAKGVRYQMTASGFGELNSRIFYDPYLARKIEGIGKYFAALGVDINELLRSTGGGIDPDSAIAVFLDLILGKGIPPNLGLKNQPKELHSTAGSEAPYGYMVPAQAGQIMGVEWADKDKAALSYSDMLVSITGVQEYSDSMYPDIKDPSRSRKTTGLPLQGIMLVAAPQLSNKTVWSILQSYLNGSVNEMYACLMADDYGNILPHIIARQFPYSTPNVEAKIPVTKFHNLPRWVMHPAMVRSWVTGRTKGLKFNWVAITGDPGPMKDPACDISKQRVMNPPIRDELEISRSGLKDYNNSVNLHPKSIRDGTLKGWTEVISDFIVGQHMCLTGTIQSAGIQAPIPPGDNLEIDGILYHIESVGHHCAMTGDRKTFSTTLSLSHGVAVTPSGTDLGLYACVGQGEGEQYEPGYTNEIGRIAPLEPLQMSFDKKEQKIEPVQEEEKKEKKPQKKIVKIRPRKIQETDAHGGLYMNRGYSEWKRWVDTSKKWDRKDGGLGGLSLVPGDMASGGKK